MKPLYKWPGGKASELEIIRNNIPKGFNKYIEPFFGGGALFFDLSYENNVINELNKEVVIFLSLIKKGMGIDIYNEMSKLSNDEKTYYEVRSSTAITDLEVAVRFYYLRKTCFRGLVRYNKSGGFNAAYGHYKTYNFEELLDKRYEELLSNTIIMNDDFSKVFEENNKPDSFCFLDPPYHNAFSNYMSDGFTDERHIELARYFEKSNMKCLMIIGKTDLIEELYDGYIVGEYGKKYLITKATDEERQSKEDRKIKENSHLIIRNF